MTSDGPVDLASHVGTRGHEQKVHAVGCGAVRARGGRASVGSRCDAQDLCVVDAEDRSQLLEMLAVIWRFDCTMCC